MAAKKTTKRTPAKPARKADARKPARKADARKPARKADARKPARKADARVPLIVKADDRTFTALIAPGKLPVLVDFSASWCGPCQALAKVLPDVAKKFARKLRVVRLDVDESPKTADRFAIEGVPTLLLFQDGKLVGASEGFGTRQSVEAWLSDVLSGRKRGPHGDGHRCCG
ncbi:MAG: thioredoxin family protein [Deltaproteobacteria bacterium]|nr:thioredoxin family protein [Deltaproteobacteria bacterium]